MKIALYIEDGFEQIILTPSTDTERNLLAKLRDPDIEMTIQRGEFFHCRADFLRKGDGVESTMICLNRKPVDEGEG